MKKLALSLAALALVLTGCAEQPGHVGSAGSVALTISKATGTADSTYIAAYNAGVASVRLGKLSRADFLTYEALAYDAILLIRAAHTIADLTAAQAQLASAVSVLNPAQ